jgi:uncharacterized paraquat-inducible protein A
LQKWILGPTIIAIIIIGLSLFAPWLQISVSLFGDSQPSLIGINGFLGHLAHYLSNSNISSIYVEADLGLAMLILAIILGIVGFYKWQLFIISFLVTVVGVIVFLIAVNTIQGYLGSLANLNYGMFIALTGGILFLIPYLIKSYKPQQQISRIAPPAVVQQTSTEQPPKTVPSSIHCITCGAENPPNATYCHRCGSEIFKPED